MSNTFPRLIIMTVTMRRSKMRKNHLSLWLLGSPFLHQREFYTVKRAHITRQNSVHTDKIGTETFMVINPTPTPNPTPRT